MPDTADHSLENRLVSLTRTYLDQLADCVALLPRLVDEYASDGPYQQVAARIRSVEGDCDETVREVTALVANADARDLGIRLSRVHIHASQTIELYQSLDEVANAAERLAEDLVAVEPPRVPELLDALAQMATCAVDAMTALRGAVVGYLGALCAPDAAVDVTADVQTVRNIESETDRLRNEVVAGAFGDHADSRPAVYREHAWLLDEVIDAMEDVTDRVVRVSGADVGIDAEPDRPV
jgi:uncharacterized protein Yka (UPF0111/DUF47 family)